MTISLEIKSAKSGNPIAVIDGVHLHSAFNPVKEAELFVENHLNALKQKNKVLVLGLGLGYHVQEIIKNLSSFHDNFQIVVIEPSAHVAAECLTLYPTLKNSIVLYPGVEIKKLYQDITFSSFLMSKPAMIVHQSSFNFHQEYFKNLLSFEAGKDLAFYRDQLNPALIHYFKKFPQEATLSDCLATINNQEKLLSKEDFLLAALGSIITDSKKENQNNLQGSQGANYHEKNITC